MSTRDIELLASHVAGNYKRLLTELGELRLAMESGDRAAILDEIVDVQFYVHMLATLYRVKPAIVPYRAYKSSARRMAGKDKRAELLEARRILAMSDFEHLTLDELKEGVLS